VWVRQVGTRGAGLFEREQGQEQRHAHLAGEHAEISDEALLVMRWLGLIGLNSIRFERLDGLRNPLLMGLEVLQPAALFDDSLVEFVELLFQVGQMRFDFFEALREIFVHMLFCSTWRQIHRASSRAFAQLGKGDQEK
jgi:hypothetical protein